MLLVQHHKALPLWTYTYADVARRIAYHLHRFRLGLRDWRARMLGLHVEWERAFRVENLHLLYAVQSQRAHPPLLYLFCGCRLEEGCQISVGHSVFVAPHPEVVALHLPLVYRTRLRALLPPFRHLVDRHHHVFDTYRSHERRARLYQVQVYLVTQVPYAEALRTHYSRELHRAIGVGCVI